VFIALKIWTSFIWVNIATFLFYALGLCGFFWVHCNEDMDNDAYHRLTLALFYFWVWGRLGEWRKKLMYEKFFEGDEELGDD
jgi:hypothetical protein